jgi:hypothetical protein
MQIDYHSLYLAYIHVSSELKKVQFYSFIDIEIAPTKENLIKEVSFMGIVIWNEEIEKSKVQYELDNYYYYYRFLVTEIQKILMGKIRSFVSLEPYSPDVFPLFQDCTVDRKDCHAYNNGKCMNAFQCKVEEK